MIFHTLSIISFFFLLFVQTKFSTLKILNPLNVPLTNVKKSIFSEPNSLNFLSVRKVCICAYIAFISIPKRYFVFFFFVKLPPSLQDFYSVQVITSGVPGTIFRNSHVVDVRFPERSWTEDAVLSSRRILRIRR